METEPSAQSPFQKKNFGHSSLKLRRSIYQICLALSNFTWFLCFVPLIFSRIDRYIINTLFFISNTLRNTRLKLAKNQPKAKLNFYHLKIICFIHPRYHPKVIGHILQNVQKGKCICFNEILLFAVQINWLVSIWWQLWRLMS